MALTADQIEILRKMNDGATLHHDIGGLTWLRQEGRFSETVKGEDWLSLSLGALVADPHPGCSGVLKCEITDAGRSAIAII